MFIIAYLTMIIDHIGILFNNIPMRLVGRISFPLFVMGIVKGLDYTHDRFKYIKRLFILAFVSQIPYMLFLHTYRLNVIFTFLFAILALYIFRFDKLFFLLYLLLISFIPIDYGIYGVLLFLIFNIDNIYFKILLFFILNVIYVIVFGDILQLFSILSLLFINIGDIKINRYFKYSIYPLQFIILEVLKIWIIHKY